MNKQRRKDISDVSQSITHLIEQVETVITTVDKMGIDIHELIDASEHKSFFREELVGVLDNVEGIREDAKDHAERVREIQEEEQEYYDSMPEGLQGSEKGELAQAAIDALEEAITNLEELENVFRVDCLEDALSNLSDIE